ATGAPDIEVTSPEGDDVADGGTDGLGTSSAAGQPASITYTITNSGSVPLMLAPPSVAGNVANASNVTVDSLVLGTTNIAPASSTTLTVSYTPTMAGDYGFDLSLTDPGGTQIIRFSASGRAAGSPEIAVSSSEGGAVANGGTDSFGSTPAAGTSARVTYTITNSGTDTLSLSTPTAANESNVTIDSLTLGSTGVAPSESTTLVVTYTPTTAGAFGFDLSLGNNDPDEGPYEIAASGTAAGRPTVVLSGAPGEFAGTATFRVTATFSETMTGFDASDVAVRGGSAKRVAGTGAVYTLTIAPDGNDLVSVSIPEGGAMGRSGLTNLASNVVTVENMTAEITRAEIAEFMGQRASLLIASQPDLHRLVFGKSRGSFSVSTRGDTRSLDFHTGSERPVWMSLQGSWATADGAESDYVFGAVGGHTWLDDNTALGAMVELDSITREDDDVRIEGQGWLAGPYLAFKLPDRPLYLQHYVLYGRTYNEISPFGTYTDDFETERFLVHAELTGEYERERMTWYPSLAASYTSDRQLDYTDSLGNDIDSQRIELGSLALGLDFDRALGQGITPWSLDGGVQASYTYSYGANGSSTTLETFEGARARVELGVTRATENANLRLSGFYDGLGASDLEFFGLAFTYDLDF
ncbi:choice-of-anchor D domain-containing protein, partial [Mesobaculum littorinae]